MKKQFILFVFLLCTIAVSSQRIKVKTGNIKNLKGINNYNVTFDYSHLKIPNYTSEEAFLKEKKALREKILVGDGERFKKSWLDDRTNLYEPYFMEFFNDFFIKKRKIKVAKNNANAIYTILVTTELIYPGYNVGVFAQNSKLFATITVYKTDSPNIILFATKSIRIRRARPNYNGGVRIANSYGLLGETFAKYLRRKT